MSEKQLLIEACEFGLICNLSNDEKNKLTESLKVSKRPNNCLLVKNVPATRLGVINQNHRVYPTALMQKAIEEAKPLMKNNMLVCSGDEHPTDTTYPRPGTISHIVTNAYIKNVLIENDGKKERQDVLFCDFLVLPTIPYGVNMQHFIENSIGCGISIRGLGECDRDGTVTSYSLLGADLVGMPSSSVYLSTPIGESVSVSVADNVPLNETFIVSASATNVVRDLDSALVLSQQIDDANFGTVKKTSTKLDSEIDPKTGAETTMVTLETETEDEVSDIDQALMMAKQAIMNGKADIDSVTIENVKEEQPKESVENKDDEKTLNEDNDWLESDENLFKTLYHSKNGNADKNRTCFEFIPVDDENVKIITTTQIKKLNGDEEIISNDEVVSKDKARTYWHKLKASGLYDYDVTEKDGEEYVPESAIQESTITEAKEDKQEDPNNGKQFVLKTNQGFVAMDGNALKFVEKPKDAIHFVKGKEESGVIHLSGIEKILDTMGIYDVEKYYKKGTTDISVHDDVNVLAVNTNSENKDGTVEECGNQKPITEDNGSNTKYQAVVETIKNDGSRASETIPVSAVDEEGINKEVGNLYDMKLQKGDQVNIIVVDTSTNQSLIFNPETHSVEMAQMESAGDLEQNGNKLSMEVDDNNKVEKEFKTPAQAAVAKAGIESGKMGGDVLLSEDDEESETVKCAWCGEEAEKSVMKKEKDLGWLCNTCAKAIASREGPLTFDEDLANDPYIYHQGKDEIDDGQEPDMDKIADSIRYIAKKTNCSLKDAMDIYEKITDFKFDRDEKDSQIDEVMYNEPGEASDPYIEKPLNEEDKTFGDLVQDKEPLMLDITFKDIDWNDEDLINNFTNNAEADDPVDIGDIESKLEDLPDEATITVNLMELPSSNDGLERALFDKLGEKYAMHVNKAVIKAANIAA